MSVGFFHSILSLCFTTTSNLWTRNTFTGPLGSCATVAVLSGSESTRYSTEGFHFIVVYRGTTRGEDSIILHIRKMSISFVTCLLFFWILGSPSTFRLCNSYRLVRAR